MIGYLKPYPLELLGKEMLRYRSVYCGLCHRIEDRYGQVPRLALTYDMTTFAVLMLAFEAEEGEPTLETCHYPWPSRKRPVAAPSAPLDYAADVTFLLLQGKLLDDEADGENFWRRAFGKLSLRRAFERARERLPELSKFMDRSLAQEREATKEMQGEAALRHLAELMREIFLQAPWPPGLSPELVPVMGEVGDQLGRWIYIMDALEDQEEDEARGRFNLGTVLGREAIAREAESIEASLDQKLALLPYAKDAELIGNLVLYTFPETRRRLLAGEKLWKV